MHDIGQLKNLTYLNLHHTNISDVGLEKLHDLQHLRHLYLWGTQVSDAGVQRLQAARPDLEITRGLMPASLDSMRIQLSENLLKATVHNPEQEEAEEEIEVEYKGEEFEIGFNVSYFIDALAAIKADAVQVHFIDANHSCLLNGVGDQVSKYVIMPMRL